MKWIKIDKNNLPKHQVLATYLPNELKIYGLLEISEYDPNIVNCFYYGSKICGVTHYIDIDKHIDGIENDIL